MEDSIPDVRMWRKNKMFQMKLINVIKILTNYKYVSYKCFTLHVNIHLCVFAERHLSICRPHSGGAISELSEGAYTTVDHGVLSDPRWWNHLPTNRGNSL